MRLSAMFMYVLLYGWAMAELQEYATGHVNEDKYAVAYVCKGGIWLIVTRESRTWRSRMKKCMHTRLLMSLPPCFCSNYRTYEQRCWWLL